MSAISQQDWQDQEDGRALRYLDEATDKERVLWALIRLDENTYRVVLSHADRPTDKVDGPSITSAVGEALKALM